MASFGIIGAAGTTRIAVTTRTQRMATSMATGTTASAGATFGFGPCFCPSPDASSSLSLPIFSLFAPCLSASTPSSRNRASAPAFRSNGRRFGQTRDPFSRRHFASSAPGSGARSRGQAPTGVESKKRWRGRASDLVGGASEGPLLAPSSSTSQLSDQKGSTKRGRPAKSKPDLLSSRLSSPSSSSSPAPHSPLSVSAASSPSRDPPLSDLPLNVQITRAYRHLLKAGYAAVKYSHLARPDIRNYIRCRFNYPHGSSTSVATSSAVVMSSEIRVRYGSPGSPSPLPQQQSSAQPHPLFDRAKIYNTLLFLKSASDPENPYYPLTHKIVKNIGFVTHHRPSQLWYRSRCESGVTGSGPGEERAAVVSKAMAGWERAIKGLNGRFGMCL